jgi:branched-subunit amino acid ABC-type transport system permease component
MSAFLPFVIAGITAGSLYGLAAAGLVLTYKTSGIFNFAHGALAASAAYVFYELHQQHGLAWPVALVLSVLVFAPLVGVVLHLLADRLLEADVATRIVATVGLLLAISGLATRLYGVIPLDSRAFFPTTTFTVAGTGVSWDQVITVVISLVAVGALLAFLRTRLGTEMRAVVDNAELVDLIGSSPAVIRLSSWVIGSCFAALSGVLLAPRVGLEATILTLLVVQAFGAAAVGRFQNLGATYAAGIGIGVLAALSTKYVASQPRLGGLPPSIPFIVLFVVLLASGRRTVEKKQPPRPRLRSLALPAPARAALAAGAALAVALIPRLVGVKLPVYTNAAIYVTIFTSLALLVNVSRQVSLCHATFVAIGATTFSHLTHGAGLGWFAALFLTGLAVVPIGAVVAIPAIRLSGLYLALATFGFGILVERLVYPLGVMFGSSGNRVAPRPGVLGLHGDKGFFYLCAAVAILAIVLSLAVGRSRLGRLLGALADSPVALTTIGTATNVTRVLVFCISAFLAGVGGALLAALTGTVNGTGLNAFLSLTLLAVLTISGRSLVVAPVVASALFVVLPAYNTSPNMAAYQQIAFGLAALGVCAFGPAALRWFDRASDASMVRRTLSPVASRTAATEATA